MNYTKDQVRRAYGKDCTNSPIAPYAYRLQKNGNINLYKHDKMCGVLDRKMFGPISDTNPATDPAYVISQAISEPNP